MDDVKISVKDEFSNEDGAKFQTMDAKCYMVLSKRTLKRMLKQIGRGTPTMTGVFKAELTMVTHKDGSEEVQAQMVTYTLPTL